MPQPNYTFILLVLAGSASSVFYTKGTDNDYPRIGRRNDFTEDSGIHYPRIGRRDAKSSQLLLPGLEFTDVSDFPKRGVFTQSVHGSYPRVGRGMETEGVDRGRKEQVGRGREEKVGRDSERLVNGETYMNERRHELLDSLVGIKDEIEEAESSKGGNRKEADDSERLENFHGNMFTAFDLDGDGKLSKVEFSAGLTKYIHQSYVC